MMVEYGQGKAESAKVRRNGDSDKVIMAYIPPKTSQRSAHIHEKMLNDMVDNMNEIHESCTNEVMMGISTMERLDGRNAPMEVKRGLRNSVLFLTLINGLETST